MVSIADKGAGDTGIIICYGDSNTYGYDPVSGGAGRYPPDIRWTGILHMEGGFDVRNHGVCGREIPHYSSQTEFAKSQFDDWRMESASVSIWVMLGTNDLLMNPGLKAGDVADRMEAFLKAVMPRSSMTADPEKLLLIAPPPMKPGAWVESEAILRESGALGRVYAQVAAKLGIGFTDAGKWGISLAYDGVHFSAEGHREFAAGIKREVLLKKHGF